MIHTPTLTAYKKILLKKGIKTSVKFRNLYIMNRPVMHRAISLITVLIFLAVFAWPLTAEAASGSPDAPKISSCTVKGAAVTIKWKKAAGAKAYRVYLQTGKSKWVYWKKVRKTKANKRKYSNNLKYKLKSSGKRYKVYRQLNPYKVALKSTKKRTYTFKGEPDTTYRLAVRSINGNLRSRKASVKMAKTPDSYQIRYEELSQVKPANVQAVRDYADRLYKENKLDNYVACRFTWDAEARIKGTTRPGWIYYNGAMMEAFLMSDPAAYNSQIRDYYNQNIKYDPASGTASIPKYIKSKLDSVLPAIGMERLLQSGMLSKTETVSYKAALQFVYTQLEKQKTYPEAGNLQAHSQKEDGSLSKLWTKWNIALDGIYMSQVYLIRLADLIDSGEIVIPDKDGNAVSSEDILDDVCSRMMFIMSNLRNMDSGLLYHGYNTDRKEVNGVTWSRGMGWYCMALLEAAEGMNDPDKRAALTSQFASLMESVMRWQDAETFLWYNVTDHREDVKDNKPETSGSAMFAYCLLRGYHDGLLDDEAYREAGLRAFNSMVETRMTDEGLIDTMKSSGVTSDINRYAINKYVVNEAKGIAPLIMASCYVNEDSPR